MSSEIPRHWRLKEQRLRLIGEVCENCDEKIFPPRDVCPHCKQLAQKKFEFSGRGTVESFTEMQKEGAPEGFEEQTPYIVAHVRLEEGPLVTAQLTDLEITHGTRTAKVDQIAGWEPIYDEVETTDFVVEIGMPVEMVTRKLKEDGDRGLIDYRYKFRPLIPRQG